MKKIKLRIGFILLGITILYFLVCTIFIERSIHINNWEDINQFLFYLGILASVFLMFDFTQILFDPKEYTPNTTKQHLIRKLRFRGVLFNNIAIILFLFTFLIIIFCFYLLINPSLETTKNDANWINDVTLRIGSSVLLIFLVQILFKVFKYLLRVAAFYNARADAIEYVILDESKDLEKLMDVFTPDKYDITELEKMNILDSAANALKGNIN